MILLELKCKSQNLRKYLQNTYLKKTNMYPGYKWMRCEQTERYMNGK